MVGRQFNVVELRVLCEEISSHPPSAPGAIRLLPLEVAKTRWNQVHYVSPKQFSRPRIYLHNNELTGLIPSCVRHLSSLKALTLCPGLERPSGRNPDLKGSSWFCLGESFNINMSARDIRCGEKIRCSSLERATKNLLSFSLFSTRKLGEFCRRTSPTSPIRRSIFFPRDLLGLQFPLDPGSGQGVRPTCLVGRTKLACFLVAGVPSSSSPEKTGLTHPNYPKGLNA